MRLPLYRYKITLTYFSIDVFPQLAVINLQLQQRRLLYSACNSSPNPTSPRNKRDFYEASQSEPIDLSSAGVKADLVKPDSLRSEPPKIFTFERQSPEEEAESSLETREEFGTSTPDNLSSVSSLGTTPEASGECSRKRSRSTSFEELKFEESDEDDEVFEKSPLPEASEAKPAFRPYEKLKRRFTVPAPLSNLPSPLSFPPGLHSAGGSLHSAGTSLQSPFSPHHFPFSPHFNFMDQLSPFAASHHHQSSPFAPNHQFSPFAFQPPVFRFPPVAPTLSGGEWCSPQSTQSVINPQTARTPTNFPTPQVS